jgi:hypothetical protein
VAGQPFYYFMKFQVPDPHISKAYIGDFVGGHTADDIVPSTIRIAGSIEATEFTVVPGYAGFETGPVGQIRFETGQFVDIFGAFFDTLYEPLAISGEFDDGSSFNGSAIVELIGHTSGDVNADGSINASDLSALVDWFFRGSSDPDGLIAADMDGNCGVFVGDLAYLVNYLFRGGPSPLRSTCE